MLSAAIRDYPSSTKKRIEGRGHHRLLLPPKALRTRQRAVWPLVGPGGRANLANGLAAWPNRKSEETKFELGYVR